MKNRSNRNQFMQRNEESKLREKLKEEQEKLEQQNHWVLINKEDEKINIMRLDSNIYEDQILGRRSFGGFNKNIEKLDERKEDEKDKNEFDAQKVDVSDNEMTEYFKMKRNNMYGKARGEKKRKQKTNDKDKKNKNKKKKNFDN